jgi:effector-binding domain-containing protein
MKILKWILITIVGLIALVLVVAAFLPSRVRITSETVINLPAYKVFYSLASFKDRSAWDPWITKDSTSKVTVVPVEGYAGSKFSWTSKNSGSGEMIIDSVIKNQRIVLSLSFAGMNQKASVWHDLITLGGTTKLSWGFEQDAAYPFGRLIMAIIKPKLQADYDQGLVNLKTFLEEKGVIMSSLSPILREHIPPFYAVVAEGKGTIAELSSKMSVLIEKVNESIKAQGLKIVGPPFNHYLYFEASTGVSSFEVGFPVDKPGKSIGDIRFMVVPAFSCLEAIHTGPYSEFGVSYGKFVQYIVENKLDASKEAWEFYLTDINAVPDETKWQTLIAFPLK